MSRTKQEIATLVDAIPIAEFIVTDAQGSEIGYDAVVNLDNAHQLCFRLEFASPPTQSRYRVTLVIHRRGKSSSVQSGEIRNARIATTFMDDLDVLNNPPRLEFVVIDPEPVRFHDGPGPYETTVALTPINASGQPIESETSSVSYDFVGV